MKLKSLDDEIELSKTDAKLRDRMGVLTEPETIHHAEQLRESFRLKRESEEELDRVITELQSFSQLYAQTTVNGP